VIERSGLFRPVKHEGPDERTHKQSQAWELRYPIVTDVLLSLYVRHLN
jgi:hypothetical protein